MFMVNSMYAAGLAKILDAILFTEHYWESRFPTDFKIDVLRLCEKDYIKYGFSPSLLQICQTELAEAEEARTQGLAKYNACKGLLEKCGVKPEEYETKFRLIAADHLRIGRSRYPHEWKPAYGGRRSYR